MTDTDLKSRIEAARNGDKDAFADVAAAFRGRLLQQAREQLADPDRAEDVVQEALADAFRLLERLREPAAFAAWLRAIVAKHCDRVTRRRTFDLDPDAEPEGEWRPDPETALAAAQAERALVGRVEALPESQRTVVALHYFGEVPQVEIATLLDLPLTTVKKRLHDARKRLRSVVGEPHPAPAPPGPAPDPVALHRAIRDDDLDSVRRILRRRPDLLDAHERWTDEAAYAFGLPLAHERPPLVVAASRGSRAMVELLVSLGAAVERTCACVNGESALWAASARGEREIARALLEAGADPNARNGAGLGPLHLAELRGDRALCALLLEHGADPELPDGRGRRPADHARTEPGTHKPSTTPPLVLTGIKAIDLFAPLGVGALVRLQGEAETGLTFLVAELSRGFVDRGARVLWVTWEAGSWPPEELQGLASEVGADAIEVIAGRRPLGAALARAAALRETGLDVSAVVFESEGHAVELESALAALKRGPTPTFVVRPWTAATRGALRGPTGRRPYDAWLVTDPATARRGLFPAVDVRESGSMAQVSPAHAEVRAAAIATLTEGGARAERLRAFLSQPFVVAEHRNGLRGVRVPLAETLDGAARILEGDFDATEEEQLRYLGALAGARKRA